MEGLRGVFIATLVNGSLSEDNMRSVITFDKGGTWELLQAPAADSLGGTVDCQVAAPRAASALRCSDASSSSSSAQQGLLAPPGPALESALQHPAEEDAHPVQRLRPRTHHGHG